MSLISEHSAEHFPSRAREVFDVSGAGDTVLATLGAGIAARIPASESAQLANVAAGIVVAKTGTAVVYTDDLHAELRKIAGDDATSAPIRLPAARAHR